MTDSFDPVTLAAELAPVLGVADAQSLVTSDGAVEALLSHSFLENALSTTNEEARKTIAEVALNQNVEIEEAAAVILIQDILGALPQPPPCDVRVLSVSEGWSVRLQAAGEG